MKTLKRTGPLVAAACISLGGVLPSPARQPPLPTANLATASTPLTAIVDIGLRLKIPIGIIFGRAPLLCATFRGYDFNANEPLQDLKAATASTGYSVTQSGAAYVIAAPDLTSEQIRIQHVAIPEFTSPPSTMGDLGGRLTGYLATYLEGAKGFMVNTLGKPSDEIVTLDPIRNSTVVQIANSIASIGSKGIWTLKATTNDIGPGTAVISVYSYHDSQHHLLRLECPVLPPPK